MLEENLTIILGTIYGRVSWKKMGSRSAYDIFEHRLEYARYEQSIPEFIQKICDKLSIQAPSYSASMSDFLDAVKYCRKWEKQALHMLRTRGKLLTLLASQHNKKVRETRETRETREVKTP